MTATIFLCESAFTSDASPAITCSTDGVNKTQGSFSCKFVDGNSRGSGAILAHVATGTLNLTGFTNVLIDILVPTGSPSLANNSLQLFLCSDTAGSVPVYGFSIPAVTASSSFSTLNLSGSTNMTTAIKSISLRALNGYTFSGQNHIYNLDNILATTGTVNNTKSVSVTQSSTFALPKHAVTASNRAFTQASSVVFIRGFFRSFTSTQAATVSFLLNWVYIKSASLTQASSVAVSKSVTVVKAMTQAAASLVAKYTTKTSLAFTQSSAFAAGLKAIGISTVSITQGSLSTLLKAATARKTTIQSSSSLLLKEVSAIKTYTQVAVSAFIKNAQYHLLANFLQSSSMSLSKIIQASALSFSQAASSSINKGLVRVPVLFLQSSTIVFHKGRQVIFQLIQTTTVTLSATSFLASVIVNYRFYKLDITRLRFNKSLSRIRSRLSDLRNNTKKQ